MTPPSGAELVGLAVAEPRRGRLIALALAGQQGNESTAAAILGAHERGDLEDSLVAELLGSVGHAVGYPTARWLLWEGAEAASTAGIAIARIGGARASADLALALSLGESRATREGAALGLAELGDPALAPNIAEAGCDGRIRSRVASRCVLRLPVGPQLYLGYLHHEGLEHRRFGTEVVYTLLLADNPRAQVVLSSLGEPARQAVRRSLNDAQLYMLPDKRAALEAWSDAR